VITTASVESLVHLFADRGASEYRRMLRATEASRIRRLELVEGLRAAHDKVWRSARHVASVPEFLTRAELEARSGGESRTDLGVVRERRSREHVARCATLARESQTALDELTQIRSELAQLCAAIAAQEAQMRVQWARLYSHTLRRIAAYHQRLQRVHPIGHRLVELLPRLGPPQLAAARESLSRLASTPMAGLSAQHSVDS
jgi:hypothetical protein